MEKKVQHFFLRLDEHKSTIASKLRELILSVDPGIKEDIKWNQLTFSFGKKNIAFIYSLTDKPYINLGFFDAVSLQDPAKHFEGTGKRMRHIKINSAGKIPEEQIKNWVREVIDLNMIKPGQR